MAKTGSKKPATAKNKTKRTVRAVRGASASMRMRDKRKAPRRKEPRAAGDAIALLKRDHTRLKSLLSSLQTAQTLARRESLFEQTAALLKQHTEIEEQIFYPAFREAAQNKRDRQLFHEATEEHHTVDLVLPEVKQARHEPDVFAARAKVLKELVEHHIEEEHDDLFPRARRLLTAETLRQLGAQMAEHQRAAKRPGALQSVGQLIGLTS